MNVLSHLEPKRVMEIFGDLCAIPHGSGNTKAVSDWCMDFGRRSGLECYQDAANNVILIAPAAAGYEDAPAVILQGHLDMVCEKEPGCTKDMARDGLDLFVEGDTVGARGTTLGGDDGIAVAMALAVLEDRDLPHPRLEAVFTTEEETGMSGAAALDVSSLQGRIMLNIDSEAEGIFTVGCAGGCRVTCCLPVDRAPYKGTPLAFRISGLVGGHSGMEIDKGRGNADKLLGRVLRAVSAVTELRLVSASGGAKDNAIPVAAEALAVVADPAAAEGAVAALQAELSKELHLTDPGVRVTVAPAETGWDPMSNASTRRAVCLLTCLPNGVQTMSADIPGLVQTSCNLGILTCDEEGLTALTSLRSSLASEKRALQDRICCLAEELGAEVQVGGVYPAWEYLPQSPLRELMTAVFREQYGHDPVIETIHAGVECGLFSEKLPGLDCVSFGPDLTDIHTPRERMHIASVQRTWALLCEVLRRCK